MLSASTKPIRHSWSEVVELHLEGIRWTTGLQGIHTGYRGYKQQMAYRSSGIWELEGASNRLLLRLGDPYVRGRDI